MYLVQAFKPKNVFINYVIGSILIFVAWQFVGYIPFLTAVVIECLIKKIPIPTNPNDWFSILELNLQLVLIIFGFASGLFALYLINKKLHLMSWLEITTSRIKIDYNRIVFGFFLWALFIGGVTALDIYLSPEDFQFNFKPIPFFILLLISLFLLPLQTSFEEYFFRGYLMQGFGVLFNDKFVTLVLTSLLFGGMHFSNPEVDKLGNLIMIYYIGMGFFLGIITLMDEGLELAIGVHAANNIVTAVLLTADWTALQTHSLYKDISENPKIEFLEIVPLIIIFLVFIFIFSKKYQWNNWREKLTGKIYNINNQLKIID